MTNRVLVTGAGGMIGRAVVDELRRYDTGVTALERSKDATTELPVDRVVIGDAGDPGVMADAMVGADAVIHLAALTWPGAGTPVEVFTGNTRGTFVVLEEAGRIGLRRCVISSSYSITGLPWAPRTLHPAYLPVDEDLPEQIEDPYGLSKLVDEAAAKVMTRRYEMAVIAVRLPFVADDQRARERLAAITADPAVGSAEMWAYLDIRDAARALRLAVTTPADGFHAVQVAAPTTLAPFATAELVERYHPGTELRRPLPGRVVPLNLDRAKRVLGFTAEHVVDLDITPLPA